MRPGCAAIGGAQCEQERAKRHRRPKLDSRTHSRQQRSTHHKLLRLRPHAATAAAYIDLSVDGIDIGRAGIEAGHLVIEWDDADHGDNSPPVSGARRRSGETAPGLNVIRHSVGGLLAYFDLGLGGGAIGSLVSTRVTAVG